MVWGADGGLIVVGSRTDHPVAQATAPAPDSQTYHGWANWETWNVALWIQNDYETYLIARGYDRYDALIPQLEMLWGQSTPDGARWMDGRINTAELDAMLADELD